MKEWILFLIVNKITFFASFTRVVVNRSCGDNLRCTDRSLEGFLFVTTRWFLVFCRKMLDYIPTILLHGIVINWSIFERNYARPRWCNNCLRHELSRDDIIITDWVLIHLLILILIFFFLLIIYDYSQVCISRGFPLLWWHFTLVYCRSVRLFL